MRTGSSLSLHIWGASELSRDLRALGKDLDKPIHDALQRGAEMVASSAKVLMRYRAEGAWKGSSGAEYDHIREYYDAKASKLSATVGSGHPAAPVWEWGGQIHPLLPEMHHMLSYRNRQFRQARMQHADLMRAPYTFDIPRLQPVGDAFALREREVEQGVENAVSRTAALYDF